MQKPNINYSNMDDQYLDIGEFAGFSVILSNCDAEFRIDWFHVNGKNGTDIQLKGRNKYSFLVGPIEKQDFGAYYCKVFYGPNLEYVFTSKYVRIYESRIYRENFQKCATNSQQFENLENKRNFIPLFPPFYEENQICITSQPNDIVASVGGTVTFVCQVAGDIRCIEWENEYELHNGQYNLSFGATENITIRKINNGFFNIEMSLSPIQPCDSGFYRFKIRNEHHEIYSRWAELKCRPINNFNSLIPHPVMQPFPESYNQAYHNNNNNNNLPPIVIINPKGGYYKTGTDVQLQSKFENASSYQWFRNGYPLAGCVGNALNIHGVKRLNEGLFQVIAYNINGQTSSIPTMVTVFD